MRRLAYLALLATLFLLVALCIRTESAVDLGLHIKAGETIVLEKHRIYEDPFTFTASPHKYIDLSWIFQIIVYFLWCKSGILGIALLKLFVVLAAFWLLFKSSTLSQKNLMILFPLFLLSIFICESRFYARPELFTFFFISATLYVFYRYKKESGRSLWPLVLINFLWVNIHGFFVLGWGILFCFLAGELIEGRKPSKHVMTAAALSIAVCFLNPYGYEGVAHPFSMLKGLGGSIYSGVITELIPPFSGPVEGWMTLSSPIFLYACLIAVSLIAILLNIGRQSFFNIFIYLLFLTISLKAKRNVPFFCFAVVPMTAWNLEEIWARIPRSKYLRLLGLCALTGVLLFVAVTICEVVSGYYYVKERRPENFGIGMGSDMPVKAVEFVNSQGLIGNVFNHFNYGGYLLWRLSPGQKVFIDGRTEVMGESLYEYYYRSMASGPFWEECVNKYRINWVIAPCSEIRFLQMLYKSPDWALVYLDGTTAVFVKDAEENREILKKKLPLEQPYQAGAQLKESAFRSFDLYWAPENSIRRFFKGRFSSQRFPIEYIHKGNVLSSFGYFDRAEELYLESLLNSPQYYESLFNLGINYFLKGRYRDSIHCFMGVLTANPDHRMAQEWLARCGPYSLLKQ